MKKEKLAKSQLLPDDAEQLDASIAKRLDQLENDPYSDLAKQCREEFRISWDHQKPKKEQQLIRLKLYNNQKKNPEAIGDTTMQDVHSTITASLYVDRLNAEFVGMEEGDDEQAEALNHLAKYDYIQMRKDIIDYDWIWDAGFFGRGYVLFEQYIRDPERNIYLPVPEVLDPAIVLRDPKAKAMNGKNVMGVGSARFWGYPIKMTKRGMMSSPHFFPLDFSKIKYESNLKPMDLLKDAHEQRNNAQNLQNDSASRESLLGDNGEYDLIAWYTHFNFKGGVRKVKVFLANDLKDVVGIQALEPVDTPAYVSRWKCIDRPLYPHSHDWDGTSIPDLTEDKQRARAVAINLGMRAMKSDLYANYLYDSTRITNRNDLKTGFNKMIPVDGKTEGAIEAVRKAQPNLALLNFIYQSLDLSAQKATATPESSQGVLSRGDNTLGEIDKAEAGAQGRRGLSAKVLGISEREFWLYGWYGGYKENYADNGVDEKTIRINGVFGAKFRPLRREDFITSKVDPDVYIESSVMARIKQLEERQSLTAYISLVVQDPTVNKRYGLKKLGKAYNFEKDELDRLFPPTIDERTARKQNEQLSLNQQQPVLPEDDHIVHLIEHASAKDTPATRAHIATHEMALSIKKTRPDLFPKVDPQQDVNSIQGGQKPIDGSKATDAPVIKTTRSVPAERAVA